MVEVKETDFPRDQLKKVTSKKRKLTDSNGAEPTKPKKQLKQSSKDGKSTKNAASWVHNMTRDMFIDGLSGIGIVSYIFDDHMLLETASAVNVTVPISEISKQFTEAYNDGKITLEQAFTVGQAVQFRILPKDKKDSKKSIKATCNPAKLNTHLTPAMLSTGLVLLSTVSSVQEKGAILDIGMDKIQGFVASEKLQNPQLIVGQPLMVRIESVQSRVVQVTAFVEQDNLCMGACEKLQLNHLMPGTILDCEPTDDEPTAVGITVSIGNGLKGILPRKNLPPRLRESTTNLGKSVRAVVVFCQQNSNVLILNAHPDIVALSKIERRTFFEGISLGDRIKCTIFDVVLSSNTVYLHLPQKDGKKSLVIAVCQKSFLDKVEKFENEYEIGTERECRVMGFRYMERSLIVAMKKEILKQTFVTYNEAICGNVVNAKVQTVTKGGIFFIVEHFIRGFMPINMISDKGASFIRTKFPIDSIVKVKMWDVDEEKKRVIVTTRESIMESKGPSIQSISDVTEGARYPALIIQKFVTGGILMKTFRGVCGVMLNKQANHLATSELNDVIEVQVESVADGKITFVPAESTTNKMARAVTKPKKADEHLDIAKTYQGEGKIPKQGAPLVVTVDAGKINASLTVEDHFLSDRLEAPVASIRAALTKPKKLTNVVPLGRVNGEGRAILSGFASYWLKRNTQPATFEDVKKKDVVLAIINQIIDGTGTFVELVGGSGLCAKLFLEEGEQEKLQLGQLVLCSVKKIDEKRKLFTLELTNNSESAKELIDEVTMPLLRSIVDDIHWLAENGDFPVIGTKVDAKISKSTPKMTIAKFTHNKKKLSGIVKGDAKKGSKFVIADVNTENNEIILAVLESDKPRIVAQRKDYLCAVDKDGLIILPARIHLNQMIETEGDVDVQEEENLKHVRIGYTKGSLETAKTILTTEKPKKPQVEKEDKTSASSTKVCKIYDAVVIDEEPAVKNSQKPSLFVKLSLPGDTEGRLHVSELTKKRREVKANPISAFVQANKEKTVLVKVIGYTKVAGKTVADVTMIKEKMEEVKTHQKLFNYKTTFKVGEKVECFSAGGDGAEEKARFELNGVWTAWAARENLPKKYLGKDVAIPRGTRLEATVISVNERKNLAEITFGTVKEPSFTIGEELTGRVLSVSQRPLNVIVKLDSGHQAILAPTAITADYENAADIIKKTCTIDEVVKVVAIKKTEKPNRYFVSLVERYQEEDPERRRLVTNCNLKVNDLIDGFVTYSAKNKLLVEVGPGVTLKVKNTPEFKNLTQNAVVTLKVKDLENGPWAEIVNVLTVSTKKRTASVSEAEVKPKKAKKAKETKKTVKVADPGFDWSDSTFQAENLAAVGKIKIEDKDEDKKMSKKTKNEAVIDENEEKLSEEELQKQVRSEPNSALVWIKYLTLFLEKNDLTAARATAERALETISYKEEAEMANMWTAYLNMEVAYGDAQSVQKVFERACNNADSYSIHKKLAQIYENASKSEEAKQIYEAMVKKFRADHFEVWPMLAEHHMASGNTKAARDLLPRALDSSHKKNHIQILQKFALIEFKNGDKERGKTIFESLCTEYPKKTDIWLVYADAALKYFGVELARSILERAVAVGNTMHMLRPLYKKWVAIEEQHGDADSLQLVKSKAEKYIQSVADSLNS